MRLSHLDAGSDRQAITVRVAAALDLRQVGLSPKGIRRVAGTEVEVIGEGDLIDAVGDSGLADSVKVRLAVDGVPGVDMIVVSIRVHMVRESLFQRFSRV